MPRGAGGCARRARPPHQVEDVLVTARKPQVVALSKTIQDTPQVINVLPKELLESQGVSSLQQALKNVPGVTLNAGEGGSHGDSINLRGFAASDDFFLDGLRDTGFYTRDPFNLEGVEVYKGPASTLFGRGSTGGVVNQVSRLPTLEPLATASVTTGAKDARIVADLDAPIGTNAAVLLTAMDQDSGVEGRAYVHNRRWGFAPSATLGIGGPDTLTVGWYHEAEDNTPDYGVPFVGSRPAPVPHGAYYGLVKDDVAKTHVDIVTGRYTHPFSASLTFTDIARYGHYGFDTRETAPHWGARGRYDPVASTLARQPILVFRRPSERLKLGLVETCPGNARERTDLAIALGRGNRPDSNRRRRTRPGVRGPRPLRQPAQPDRADAAARSRSVRSLPRSPDCGDPTSTHAHRHPVGIPRRYPRLRFALDASPRRFGDDRFCRAFQ